MSTSSVAARPSVLLLVRSLERGGAERQVVMLARELHRCGQPVKVISFYDGGAFRPDLERAGVPVVSLGKSGRWDVLRFVRDLLGAVRRERPAVLYSFLTVPNVIAALLKPLLGGTRLVWGVRASDMDVSRYDWFARATARLETLLARCADVIICNSHAGQAVVLARGFPRRSLVVVPNGIDVDRFRPDPGGRAGVRAEWGVGEENVLIGLVARLDPMKDHATFLRAAQLVLQRQPAARFVCVGDRETVDGERARQLCEELGIADRMTWAGARADMHAVHAALDVACSSSCYGEGFSNAIGEAMACGTPCAVTDVGDSAQVVGHAGIVVPAGTPERLADAMLQLAALSPAQRADLGKRARARIEAEFSVGRMVRDTLAHLGVPVVDSP